MTGTAINKYLPIKREGVMFETCLPKPRYALFKPIYIFKFLSVYFPEALLTVI